MDPLTIPLALGCILTFSHVDHAMTEEYGQTPDGVMYKTAVCLFASYVVLEYAAGHNTGDVRFVSAKTCAPVRFVRVRNGATVDAVSYEGWLKDSPHGVRAIKNTREYDLGLPIDEARLANPRITDTE